MGLAEAGEATEPIPIQVAADAHSESNPSGEKDAPDAGVVPDDHEPEDLSLHAFVRSISSFLEASVWLCWGMT